MKKSISITIAEVAYKNMLLFFEGEYKNAIVTIYEDYSLLLDRANFKAELFYLSYFLAIDAIGASKYGSLKIGISAKNELEKIFILMAHQYFFSDTSISNFTKDYNMRIDNCLSIDKKCEGDGLRYFLITLSSLHKKLGVEVPVLNKLQMATIMQLIQNDLIKKINALS